MSTINYTYNVIVDRFRQFAAGHFQLRRFTHGEISQADLEKEAEWPWLHVKPRAINYSPGTRAFSFEIFISDLPRDKEDKTGYQAESITDCSLIFQDLINEIYLGNMFGSDVVLTRPVSSEPFVEQYTHTLTGVTGTIELSLDYDWSACSIPASWNYNTPTDSGSDGWGALQFIESLNQNGAFVSLDNDEEAPGNSYYYGTDETGVKGWHAIVDNVGLTCETLPECATIISILDDIAALQTDVALKANTADLGATAFSNDYNDLDNLPTIPAGGLPAGGTAGQILTKVDATDYNATWQENYADWTSQVKHTVKNNGLSGTITKGTAVYVTGSNGTNMLVGRASNTSEATSSKTMGLMQSDITTTGGNQTGFVITEGLLGGLNTASATAGDPVWLGVNGALIYGLANKPYAPAHLVFIGIVTKISAGNGEIFVKVQNGFELKEIHDVDLITTTPINGHVLGFDGTLWVNKTVASWLGFTPVTEARTLTINGTSYDLSADRSWTISASASLAVGTTAITSGTIGRVLFEGTGNVLQQSANLFWDNTNGRLGIGTSSPTQILDVNGLSLFTSASYPVARFVRTTTSTNFRSSTNDFLTSTSNDMVDGFGSQFTFSIRDNANVVNNIAILSAVRTGSDNSGSILFKTFLNGVETDQFRIFPTGNTVIQNGGTFTDAGYRLDVNGTARVKNDSATHTLFSNSSGRTITIQGTNLDMISSSGYIQAQSLRTANVRIDSTIINGFQSSAFNTDGTNFYLNSRPNTASPIKLFAGSNGTATANKGTVLVTDYANFSMTPEVSAQLQVESTVKGFLPPRMTTTQKNAIATPVAGLVVYDTTLGKLCVRGASAWETITSI